MAKSDLPTWPGSIVPIQPWQKQVQIPGPSSPRTFLALQRPAMEQSAASLSNQAESSNEHGGAASIGSLPKACLALCRSFMALGI